MNRFKKYLTTTISSILCVFCLSACAQNEYYQDYQPIQGSMFSCVEVYEDPYLGTVRILVDSETRIMYMYAIKDYADQESSCITVLYNSDGKPKKYSGVIAD